MRIEFTALHFHWPFSPRGAIKVVYKEKEVFLVLFSARPGQNEGEMATISHWEPFILLRLSFACSQAPTKMFSMTQESFNGVGNHPVFLQYALTSYCTKKILFALFWGPQKMERSYLIDVHPQAFVFFLVTEHEPYAIGSLASPFTAVLCLSPKRQTTDIEADGNPSEATERWYLSRWSVFNHRENHKTHIISHRAEVFKELHKTDLFMVYCVGT